MSTGHETRLRAYLARIAPSGSIDELVTDSAAQAEAAKGGTPAASAAARSEKRLLEKVALGQSLDPREQFELEAIIIPDKRPAIDIRGGDFEVSHPMWRHWNQSRVKAPLRRAIQSIGRIDLPGHPRFPYAGTGFVVGSGLLMTNRHVAELFSRGLGVRKLTFTSGMAAAIDFLHERDRSEQLVLDISGIAMIHPYWDMALLRVEGLGPAQVPLSLDATDPEALVGRQVALIGYPAFDPRNPADVQDRVFGAVYQVKRIKPGIVGRRGLINSYGFRVDPLTHDASTLGGDSGAPVVDADTGDVVALHFGGTYLVANYGIPAYELARDSRIVDAGVTFARPISPSPAPWDHVWRSLDTSETTQVPARTSEPLSDASAQPTQLVRRRATVQIPIEVTISIDPVTLTDVSVAAAATTEKAVEPVHDTDYVSRPGYDEDFLGITLPMPLVDDASLLAQVRDGGTELRYQHFSIFMHARRKMALLSASNIDASPGMRRPEPKPPKDYTRDGLGGLTRKDTERWFGDNRIGPTEQLSDRFFNQDRQAFDKGHLVRREDVAWGETYKEMQRANGDTYHITNCTPQVKDFNRSSTPGTDTNWGDLENYVMKQAKTQRVSLFAGPVFADADETFLGVSDESPVRVRIPSRFWKVIVVNDGDALMSFAFLLKQDLSGVAWEMAVSPIWTPFMLALSDLEALTGLTFPDVMHDGDQYGTGVGESVRLSAMLPELPEDSQPAWPFPAPAPKAKVPVPRIDAPANADALAPSLQYLEPLLDMWRNAQRVAGSPSSPGVRFALNYPTDAIPADAAVEDEVRKALGLDVRVTPMFAPDSALDAHRLLTVAGVPRADRSDLFEMARVLRRLTLADTVEPDVASGYYDWDHETPVLGPESANMAFWCWADDTDRPQNADWAVVSTGVPQAWQYSEAQGRPSRGEGIRVFQLDTGIVEHAELPADLVTNPGAVNLLERDRPPIDPMNGGMNPGHGTGTSSVVVSPEAGLMRGTAPRATLVPVRCIETVAVFDQSYIAQAIDHARTSGAHVITMSLGGVFSRALHAALRRAVQDNIIVVAAAGNCVGTVVWPARYDEAIAVGGTNAAGKAWRGSSRGSAVDVSGPAEFVQRADPRVQGKRGTVSPGQGTSFATAHLAGVAALWLAHHDREALIRALPSGATLQQQFRALARATATVPNDFDTSEYGAGIVNARALLERDPATVLGHESVSVLPRTDMQFQLADLLTEALGTPGLESAAVALRDPQNEAELACLALDNIQARSSRRARTEAMPPRAMSPGLRRVIGSRAIALANVGGPHA